jgi:citrate lyase subunit beta/citryl-CoA lyase
MTAFVDANAPRILRTMVLMPAHIEANIMDSLECGMDSICLDMEDLTPIGARPEARANFPRLAKEITDRGVAVFARVSTPRHGGAREELAEIACPELHGIWLSKAETGADVADTAGLLDEVEREVGLPGGHILVRPIPETALGIHNSFEMAAASPRVCYMGGGFGGWWGDLSSSIGYTPTGSAKETFYLRSKVLIDVRAAGVAFPVGGGSVAYMTTDEVRAFTQECKELGYAGVISPSNPELVAIAHEVFTPTREEIDLWLQAVPLLEEAQRNGTNAVRVPGTTLNVAGLKKVREQLDLARRVGLID